MALILDITPPTKTLPPIKRRPTPRQLALGASGTLLLLAAMLFFFSSSPATSVVPETIRKAVAFQVYYPEQRQLPAGYSLDTSSFQLAQAGVVIYSVLSPAHQRVIFSEEQRPSQDVIDKFTGSDIPLHTDQKTNVGQAEFGAYGTGANLRTVISLPISKGPWLIITAPPSISHNDLVTIIQHLTK